MINEVRKKMKLVLANLGELNTGNLQDLNALLDRLVRAIDDEDDDEYESKEI